MALIRRTFAVSFIQRCVSNGTLNNMLSPKFRGRSHAAFIKFEEYKNVVLAVGIRISRLKDYNMKCGHSTNSSNGKPINLDSLPTYEKVSEDTLESLYEKFEDLLEDSKFQDWDVNYSNGVLTVMLKENFVYVINKQTPNRQIWLSSPVSGPKRYDYVNGTWVYKHEGVALHQLLSKELSDVLETCADFESCSFSK